MHVPCARAPLRFRFRGAGARGKYSATMHNNYNYIIDLYIRRVLTMEKAQTSIYRLLLVCKSKECNVMITELHSLHVHGTIPIYIS